MGNGGNRCDSEACHREIARRSISFLRMDGYINASRGAFHVAVGLVNELSAERVANVAVEALKTLDSPESIGDRDNVLSALVHIYRGARQHRVAPANLGECLEKHTDLNAESTKAVVNSWAQWNHKGLAGQHKSLSFFYFAVYSP